jgi:hypothetical protein
VFVPGGRLGAVVKPAGRPVPGLLEALLLVVPPAVVVGGGGTGAAVPGARPGVTAGADIAGATPAALANLAPAKAAATATNPMNQPRIATPLGSKLCSAR